MSSAPPGAVQLWGPTAVGTEHSRGDRGQPHAPALVISSSAGVVSCFGLGAMTPFSELSSLRSVRSSEPTPASSEMPSCQLERP